MIQISRQVEKGECQYIAHAAFDCEHWPCGTETPYKWHRPERKPRFICLDCLLALVRNLEATDE